MPRSFTIVKVFVLSSFLCLAAPIQKSIAQTPKPIVSPTIDQVIERAEAYFKSGKMNLEDNKRDAARSDFDKAVDEILASGYDVRANDRLQKYYIELVERIYREEVPTTQQGTTSKPILASSATATPTPSIGFRQRDFQPSPIDPLSQLIFPEPQDKPSDNNAVIKYRAVKGDTISKIAAAYGQSAAIVSKLNGIAPDAALQPGQEIKLPVITTGLGSLQSEYLKSTQQYKTSVQRLLTLYEESEKRAQQRLTESQKRHDDKLLSDYELEQARTAVADGKLKVQETRKLLAEADQKIAEALIDAETQKEKLARDRERADELIGPKPAQSANGTIPIVIKWFNDYLHDPYSAHYVSWTKLRKGLHNGEPYWIVAVRIRAKNAFNAYRLSDYIFYIRRNHIVLYDAD